MCLDGIERRIFFRMKTKAKIKARREEIYNYVFGWNRKADMVGCDASCMVDSH
jgi:hypothetical protein